MPRLRLPPALPALLSVLALTACAPAAPQPQALSLAPSLLACREEPPVAEFPNDAAFMGWVLDVIEAGEDCRGRLARVREMIGGGAR